MQPIYFIYTKSWYASLIKPLTTSKIIKGICIFKKYQHEMYLVEPFKLIEKNIFHNNQFIGVGLWKI